MNNHFTAANVTPHVYDCVGIGFGPSNIALAIALEEKGLLDNSVFLESRDQVRWQPGMLIEGTDIQHNPLRDFVTPRNPCSPYGFLSYLKSEGRLFDYLNLSAPFPPRTEYASYVAWVASQFLKHVRLGEHVKSVANVLTSAGENLVEIQSDTGAKYFARSVVIGSGRSQNIPSEFSRLLGDNVIHSDDYIWAKEKWGKHSEKLKIAVVGGSQSAVEILLDLSGTCDVVGITRGFGFKQKDLSPFTECIYYTEFIDYFHGSDVASQNQITRELWRSNYSAADHDVIDALNFKLYEQKVTGKRAVEILQNSKIEKIEAVSDSKAYKLHLRNRHSKDRDAVVVDGIIFATGYKNFGSLENQEPCLPLLEGITSDLTFREDGGPEVLRDYRLSGSDLPVPIYLNGLCEASHGFGDAGSFSILSIRGDVIASSLQMQLSQGSSNTANSSGVAAYV